MSERDSDAIFEDLVNKTVQEAAPAFGFDWSPIISTVLEQLFNRCVERSTRARKKGRVGIVDRFGLRNQVRAVCHDEGLRPRRGEVTKVADAIGNQGLAMSDDDFTTCCAACQEC